jgi:hypothetical protein
MARTLVWMTHSFRMDSRLTTLLGGECCFVYYSPYHFAGKREREIYKRCSQENLDAFYYSINEFDRVLFDMTKCKLHVFREKDPVAHINALIAEHGFDQVIIDKPLFAMWHSVNTAKIRKPVTVIDSDLIDDTCTKMTAKARWNSHILQLRTYRPHRLSKDIQPYNMLRHVANGTGYPEIETPHPLVDRPAVLRHIHQKMFDYHETRDRHDGQTGMSVALHNGIIDPANTFYAVAKEFDSFGDNCPVVSILRQQTFREISIIQARRARMTLENTPLEWAKALMHHAAYDNLVSQTPLPGSTLDYQAVKAANTGDDDLNFLINEMYKHGTMPNRARMYFASRVFYMSDTGVKALETIINTFDLIGMDGQSPNNYTQCIGAYGLSYGKVLKMVRNTAFEKLAY